MVFRKYISGDKAEKNGLFGKNKDKFVAVRKIFQVKSGKITILAPQKVEVKASTVEATTTQRITWREVRFSIRAYIAIENGTI